jgi:hypothetical protein
MVLWCMVLWCIVNFWRVVEISPSFYSKGDKMKEKQVVVKIKGVADLIQNRKSFMLDKADHPELEKQRGRRLC